MEIETAVNAKMAVNKGTGGVNISIGADGHWYYHKQMQNSSMPMQFIYTHNIQQTVLIMTSVGIIYSIALFSCVWLDRAYNSNLQNFHTHTSKQKEKGGGGGGGGERENVQIHPNCRNLQKVTHSSSQSTNTSRQSYT